jgi:hypothetical protein
MASMERTASTARMASMASQVPLDLRAQWDPLERTARTASMVRTASTARMASMASQVLLDPRAH